MKTFKKTITQLGMLSMLTLAFSIFMTSCQKEELNSETGAEAVEIQKEQDFTRLIYDNKSYSFNEVKENPALADLLENPSYYAESDNEVIKYVFDTEEEVNKYFESGELDSQGDKALSVRFAIELFRHTYHRDRIYRRVIFLNNNNFVYNDNLGGNIINQASSSRVRVTGLDNTRKLNVRYFDRARQQGLLTSYALNQNSNGNLIQNAVFRSFNDKINSLQVFLSR
ncbi:hypothetical protein [Aquimarina sp. RZ0]|uniref:hypothetical protein n=1 Tax=Aquimarina sp. RZ0 TaxID=2607730 RepID=UPI0011F3E073|nr:hypothetical protein [Aquimarina sp. RZ0]KAA1244727.1 hypothetical protein F0000_15245 [Aquimarina sp. RZ0]